MDLGERWDLTSTSKATIKTVTCTVMPTSRTRKDPMKGMSRMESSMGRDVSKRKGTSEMASSLMVSKRDMEPTPNLAISSIGGCLKLDYFMGKER